MKSTIIIMAFPAALLLLGFAATDQAVAWGPNFQNWNGGEGENGCCGDAGYYHHHWGGVGECDSLYAQQSGPYQNGWHAGQQDAIYDHNNTIQ